MKIRTSGACCFAALVLFASAAMAEEIYSTPITAASTDSTERDRWWGPGGALIPEAEWQPYVGRKQAFSGGRAVSSADPARMPQIGGIGAKTVRKSGTAKRSGAAKSTAAKPVAAKPKAVDPCEERVRQALEEAARTGKIPASAVPPPAASQAPAPVPAAAQAQTATSAPANQNVAIPGGVVGVVQAAPPPPPGTGTAPAIPPFPQNQAQ